MSVVFFLLASFAGMAAGSYCKAKYSLGISYYKYCYDGCCSYNTYIDPCCSYSYISIYSTSLSVGAIVGIVIGVLMLIAIVVSVIVCCACAASRRRATPGQVISSTQPNIAYIASSQTGSSQGMTQPQYGGGYANTGFANQPPPYSPAYPVQPK